jgi:hypothetical protein
LTEIPDNQTATIEAQRPMPPGVLNPPSSYAELLRSLGQWLQGERDVEQLANDTGLASLVGGPIAPLAAFASGGMRMANARSTESSPAPDSKSPRAAPLTERKGVLIVADRDLPGRTYRSLRSAASAAKNGDVIELHYDGPREEEPILFTNLKLTIRPGEGHHPVVLFHPKVADPLRESRSMVSVFGGQLTMTNLHFALDVPRDSVPVDSRTLFDLRGADLVRFENCSMTIRNGTVGRAAAHPEVAFIDVKPRPGSGMMTMGSYAKEEKLVVIELRNCIARGEATFLRTNELQPVRLDWDNGLLATSEYLLVASGGTAMPRQPRLAQANLRHVTALTLSGLALLLSTEDAPFQANAEFHCTDCILSTAGPLIEQHGIEASDPGSRPEIQWNGAHNFYEGVKVFWRVRRRSETARSTDLSFRKWQEHWMGSELSPALDEVMWRDVRRSERPFHTQLPADYALDSHPGNPATGASSDGINAGLVAELLPDMPSHGKAAATPPSRRPFAFPMP